MTETGRDPLLLVMPKPTRARPPHALAITDENEDREALRQRDGRGDEEGVLQSHLRDPRCEAGAGSICQRWTGA